MSALHEEKTLYEAPGLQVTLVQCRRPVDRGGGEEATDRHEVVLPLGGVFVKEVEGQRFTADMNQVLYFNRGEPYRIRHPIPGGDQCLVLALPEPELIDMVARHDSHVHDRPDRPFRTTHSLRSTRAAFLGAALRRELHAGQGSLAVEEVALELVDAALPTNGRASANAQRSSPRHAEMAEAVQVLLAARFEETVRLADLARLMGCSRFHLVRVFRRLVGVPIHAYQLRLRLQAAVERLTEGERDLTRLALDLGFADHAHFTNSFRREFRTTPSAFRRRPPRPEKSAVWEARVRDFSARSRGAIRS